MFVKGYVKVTRARVWREGGKEGEGENGRKRSVSDFHKTLNTEKKTHKTIRSKSG